MMVLECLPATCARCLVVVASMPVEAVARRVRIRSSGRRPPTALLKFQANRLIGGAYAIAAVVVAAETVIAHGYAGCGILKACSTDIVTTSAYSRDKWGLIMRLAL